MSNALNLEPEKVREMAMVDLSYNILAQAKKPYYYRDLYKELTDLKNLSDQEAMDLIAQVYTEINLDGRFICLGENLWGLKRWYLVETQEESAEGALRGKFVLDDDDDDYDDEEDEVPDYDSILVGTNDDDTDDQDIEADPDSFDDDEVDETDEEFEDEEEEEIDAEEDEDLD
nr:DNA-directed RNA polymerase subunit delta [Aneurinibacillus terranovensis]